VAPEPAFRAFGGPDRDLGVDALLEAVVGDPAPAVEGRPRTIGVMVTSVDGHVTVDGRSGGLGGSEDRAVFRGLRQYADALLVGPATLNRERYSTTLDPPHRAAREAAGRPAEPLLATISRSLSIDPDVPFLHEPLTRAAIYTEATTPFPVDAERIEVVRLPAATPAAVLADLDARGAELVNCEGGPGLLAGLARDQVLDELLVTVSPLLVGGLDPLTMLRGALGAPGAPSTLPLRLREVWRGGDVVFLHYHLTPRSPA
jgi:riboflavin biosynthesis pyrimidine reductase